MPAQRAGNRNNVSLASERNGLFAMGCSLVRRSLQETDGMLLHRRRPFDTFLKRKIDA
jgi:hypothetical protein